MLQIEQLGLFGDTPQAPPPALAPPALPADTLQPPLACAPKEDLNEAAARLRELLSGGTWHPLAEVHGALGPDRVYPVTCWGGSARAPDAHQVPVALRGDGQGGCWYAAWPGAPTC